MLVKLLHNQSPRSAPGALHGTCCHLPAGATCPPPRAPPRAWPRLPLARNAPPAICGASHLPGLSQTSFSRQGRLAVLPAPWPFPACTPAHLPTHSISEHTKPSTDVSTGLIVHLSPPESQLSKKRDLWIFAPLCIPQPMLKSLSSDVGIFFWWHPASSCQWFFFS